MVRRQERMRCFWFREVSDGMARTGHISQKGNGYVQKHVLCTIPRAFEPATSVLCMLANQSVQMGLEGFDGPGEYKDYKWSH